MASIYDLKPRFQNLLRPISNQLAYHQVSANQVTLAALILSFVTGLLIASFPTTKLVLFLVPIVLFIRMVLNAIDGMLAREHHMKSHLGTFLNEIGDVLSDAFLYLPFMMIPGCSGLLVLSIVCLAGLSEMTGVIGVQIGASRRYEGPMGKSDRAFVFGALAFVLAIGVSPGPWVTTVLVITNLLLFVTIFNRVNRAIREVTC